jgi:hypothetical protein
MHNLFRVVLLLTILGIAKSVSAQQYILDYQEGLRGGLPNSLTLIGTGDGLQVAGDLAGFAYEVQDLGNGKLSILLVATGRGWDCRLDFNSIGQELNGVFTWIPRGSAYGDGSITGRLTYAVLLWCCSNHEVHHCGSSSELEELVTKTGCKGFYRKQN